MKFFVVVLMFWTFLSANCSQKQIREAEVFYTEALKNNEPKKQIELLKESLSNCYAPEIEATLLIIQAQESTTTKEKIGFYKNALVPISNFEESKIVIEHQCEINEILFDLYKNIDKEVSIIYKNKVSALCVPKKKESDYFWIILFFILLFVWGIWNIFS